MMNSALTFALVVAQVLDGILTYIGTNRFGSAGEGNLLIRFLMDALGILPAVVIAKGLGLFFIYLLHTHCSMQPWYGKAAYVVLSFYILAAIIPWCIILLNT